MGRKPIIYRRKVSQARIQLKATMWEEAFGDLKDEDDPELVQFILRCAASIQKGVSLPTLKEKCVVFVMQKFNLPREEAEKKVDRSLRRCISQLHVPTGKVNPALTRVEDALPKYKKRFPNQSVIFVGGFKKPPLRNIFYYPEVANLVVCGIPARDIPKRWEDARRALLWQMEPEALYSSLPEEQQVRKKKEIILVSRY